LDGASFYPQSGTRQSIYYHYNEEPNTKPEELTVWAQNSIYKKYDTTVRTEDSAKRNKLFNIRLDPDELHPILHRNRTPQEKIIDGTFKSIIHFYGLQQ
jgi:hypothetical protein